MKYYEIRSATSSSPVRPRGPHAFLQRSDMDAKAKSKRYQVIGGKLASVAGRGSYGRVYAAWDHEMERLVAVKRQPTDCPTAARELHVFHQLPAHPDMLTLCDAFLERGELCLVSRYHDRNLQQVWMHCCRHLDFSSVTRYTSHAALGLAHMHAHGLAHRDVSMPNLLVSFSDNVLQLADFGLATCASSFVLERNVACPHCRAPEVILTYTEDTDATTMHAESATQDLWSLGCVIVAMVHATFLFLPKSRTEGGAPVLQLIVNFLGPPMAEWGAIKSLPRWAEMERQLSLEPSSEKASDTLASRVPRPLPHGHPLVDLELQLLKWNPNDRIGAAAVGAHRALGEKVQTSILSDSAKPALHPTGAPNSDALATTASQKTPTTPKSGSCKCSGNCGRLLCKRMKKTQLDGGFGSDLH